MKLSWHLENTSISTIPFGDIRLAYWPYILAYSFLIYLLGAHGVALWMCLLLAIHLYLLESLRSGCILEGWMIPTLEKMNALIEFPKGEQRRRYILVSIIA